MFKFLIAVVVLVSFASCAQAGAISCDNPLWNAYPKGSWQNLEALVDAILDARANLICPDFGDGVESCCNATIYDELVVAWIAARVSAANFKAKLDRLNVGVARLVVDIDFLLDWVPTTNLTASLKSQLITYLKTVKGLFVGLVVSVDKQFAKCSIIVLKYFAGVACLRCRPVWSDWVNVVGQTVNLNLNHTTCDNLVGQCAPLFGVFYTLRNALIAAWEKIDSPPTYIEQYIADKAANYTPPCTDAKSCATFICDNFVMLMDRIESWVGQAITGSGTTTNKRYDGTEEDPIERMSLGLESVLRQVSFSPRGNTDTIGPNTYTGYWDPTQIKTGLDTSQTSSSSSPASALRPLGWFF